MNGVSVRVRVCVCFWLRTVTSSVHWWVPNYAIPAVVNRQPPSV